MRVFAVVILATLSLPALSQDIDEAREDLPTSHPEIALEDGWKFGVSFGVNLDWDYNRHQTGMDDGTFFRIGGNVKLTGAFLSGNHEWRNKLFLAETFNLNPDVNAFVKSNDRLSFESQWLWAFGCWWGSTAQVNFDASVFPGYDYHEEPQTYYITDLNNVTTTSGPTTSFKLTDAFMPTYLKESVGFFARPVKSRMFTWEVKALAYAMQGLANGELEVTNEDRTNNTIDVMTLTNFYQLGPMISTFFFGDILPKMFFYQLSADLGYIAWESSVRPLGSDFVDHLLFNGVASLTFKPIDWVALTWNVRAAYMPEINEGIEIDSKFYLSFPFTF